MAIHNEDNNRTEHAELVSHTAVGQALHIEAEAEAEVHIVAVAGTEEVEVVESEVFSQPGASVF
jgi:hypothetical protein